MIGFAHLSIIMLSVGQGIMVVTYMYIVLSNIESEVVKNYLLSVS